MKKTTVLAIAVLFLAVSVPASAGGWRSGHHRRPDCSWEVPDYRYRDGSFYGSLWGPGYSFSLRYGPAPCPPPPARFWVPGRWEYVRVWVPGFYERVWVPGCRDRWGRYEPGRWVREFHQGRYVTEKIWREGRYR